MNEAHPLDRAKVIREAYRIDGIGKEDCRSIFLEWLLGLPDGKDGREAAREVLEHHADEPADHPMSVVLREAIDGAAKAKRRGGATGRRRSDA